MAPTAPPNASASSSTRTKCSGFCKPRPPLTTKQQEAGRLVPVDKRTVVNPVSYWIDRPEGRPRPAAAELARRIGVAAGVDAAKLDAFLTAGR